MLVKTFGSALYGIHATPITVEVCIDQGINFFMVGLPDNAVKESHQRIDSALRNIGFKIPGKKITINLAPADIRNPDYFILSGYLLRVPVRGIFRKFWGDDGLD